MSAELQKAFGISPEELSQIKNGELPDKVKNSIRSTSYVIMGAGVVCFLAGIATLTNGLDTSGIVVLLALWGTGILAFYGGYMFNQKISEGKIEKATGKIKVKHSGNTYRRLKLDDGNSFRVLSRKVGALEPDTTYTVYYLRHQVLAIEAVEGD